LQLATTIKIKTYSHPNGICYIDDSLLKIEKALQKN